MTASCQFDPTEILGVLTERGEVLAMENTEGLKLLILVSVANEELKQAA